MVAAAAYVRKMGGIRMNNAEIEVNCKFQFVRVSYRLVVRSGRLVLATTSCHVNDVKFPEYHNFAMVRTGVIFFLLWAYLIVLFEGPKRKYCARNKLKMMNDVDGGLEGACGTRGCARPMPSAKHGTLPTTGVTSRLGFINAKSDVKGHLSIFFFLKYI